MSLQRPGECSRSFFFFGFIFLAPVACVRVAAQMEPPVEEAVAGKQKANSAVEEDKEDDSEDESYDDERGQSLPPGTFRFRYTFAHSLHYLTTPIAFR